MASNIDPDKCKVTIETTYPVFVTSAITLKVQLFDTLSNPVNNAQFTRDLLCVKINGLCCENVQWEDEDSTRGGNVNNVLYLNIESLGCEDDCKVCFIKLEYYDERLGNELTLDITHVIPFSEDSYIDKGVNFPSFSLKIMGIPISKLTGDGGAVVNNINRVLNSEYRLYFRHFQLDKHSSQSAARGSSPRYADVDVDISQFRGDAEECEQIYQLLALYIKGMHYRNEATKFNRKREEWKAKAVQESEAGNGQKSSECKSIKKQYSKLMDDAHKNASNALFEFFNKRRPSILREIDLHGQLVADEDKLEEYRKQLLGKYSEGEANAKVVKARYKMDEALRHLEKADVERSRGRDWLEIIVGAGEHSEDKRQRIRPKVETFLRSRENPILFKECNKGSLLINYKVYNGEQPCYGSFFCKRRNCGKTWNSPLCWRGYWQLCFKCDQGSVRSECYPMKLIAHSELTSRKYRNFASQFTSKDHRRLCQKCIESRTYCKYLRR